MTSSNQSGLIRPRAGRSVFALLTFVLTVFCINAGYGASSTDEQKVLLERLQSMSRAVDSINYKGLLVYHSGDEVPARFQIQHGRVGGKIFERLVHMGDLYRETVRHGNELTLIARIGDDFLRRTLDSDQASLFNRSFVKMFGTIPAQYRLVAGPTTRLADRNADLVKVMPRDNHRYGYRMWLDTSSDLLLRFEVINTQRNILEFFSFEEVVIGEQIEPDDTAVKTRPNQARVRILLHETESPTTQEPVFQRDDVRWRPEWLPAGFEKVSYGTHQPPRKDIGSFHSFVYSDGLAAFSLYIESISEGAAESFTRHTGSTATVIKEVEDAPKPAYMVTVVGEIPMATAHRIVQSVSYQEKPGSEPATL